MAFSRRLTTVLALSMGVAGGASGALAQAADSSAKPNFVIIWGDDIGQSDLSA